VLAGALDLMQRIFTEFTYDKSATTVDTAVDQVLVTAKASARISPMWPSAVCVSWGWRPAT
jgi:hypothetical protein